MFRNKTPYKDLLHKYRLVLYVQEAHLLFEYNFLLKFEQVYQQLLMNQFPLETVLMMKKCLNL